MYHNKRMYEVFHMKPISGKVMINLDIRYENPKDSCRKISQNYLVGDAENAIILFDSLHVTLLKVWESEMIVLGKVSFRKIQTFLCSSCIYGFLSTFLPFFLIFFSTNRISSNHICLRIFQTLNRHVSKSSSKFLFYHHKHKRVDSLPL